MRGKHENCKLTSSSLLWCSGIPSMPWHWLSELSHSSHSHWSGLAPSEPMLENWPITGQEPTSIFSGPTSCNTWNKEMREGWGAMEVMVEEFMQLTQWVEALFKMCTCAKDLHHIKLLRRSYSDCKWGIEIKVTLLAQDHIHDKPSLLSLDYFSKQNKPKN